MSGKKVILGITGGIAAYKAAEVASGLSKKGYRVFPVMTENAARFITPLTFEALCGQPCQIRMFDAPDPIPHIRLAEDADLLLIAPATADIIAKIAHGIADDLLTSTVLAAVCPLMIAPAMNTHMYENPATQENLRILRERGVLILEPGEGRLACGTEGKGRLPDPEIIIDCVEQEIACEKDLIGKKVLVTAGPTREMLDPVRFLSNRSSGKMGYAIAINAARRGADVTLVAGPCALSDPLFVKTVHITSAQEMYDAVTEAAPDQDIIIKAAAVADYRPETVADNKIKKSDSELTLPLARTKDILGTLGANKQPGQFLCGFSMETEDMIARSREKLFRKNLDMIAANNVTEEGAGFAVDTNRITLLVPDEEIVLPLLSKEEAAQRLLTEILKRLY